MHEIPFFKMTAQGNDYIYLDLIKKKNLALNFSELAKSISDRRFGIGSDGLVLIEQSKKADISMRIFNADGSEAEMCGSALRCVVFYISQELKRSEISVQTKAGTKKGIVTSNKDFAVEVNMGKPEFISELDVLGYTGSYISMGNPHFVVFNNEHQILKIHVDGKKLEEHKSFENKTNVESVKVIDSENICIDIWERGSGLTFACGTGACAAAYAGILTSKLGNNVLVKQPGGLVKVRFDSNSKEIFLSGNVLIICSGIYYWDI